MPAKYLATCPEETKQMTARELAALGLGGLREVAGGVIFEAELADAYRAHLWLRTASRIQRIVAELPVGELAPALRAVRFEEVLLQRAPFSVAVILGDGAARALGEDAVREAVVAAVAARCPQPPRYDPEAMVQLVAYLRGGTCTLGLDTAGRALHKRGWRLPGHPAVLKETLAASILLLAGYDGSEPLLDPMCGSGTLAIEGAYLALRKAPLIHRGKDDFAFEHEAGFDRALFRRVSDEARAQKLAAPPQPIFASDLKPEYVELARKTALRARVERHITFSAAPLQQLAKPAERGLVVANLPYGERIGHDTWLYRDVRALRERFTGWRAALLVPAAAPRDALGPAQQEIALANGALDVRLLLFDAR